MKPRTGFWILTLAIAGFGNQSGLGALIAITGGGGVESILYELDATSGSVVRQIGSTGLTHVTGLAFHPSTGVLYAHRNSQGTDIGSLYTIDLATTTSSFVGLTRISSPDITFASDGTLYGWMVFYEQNFPAFTDINELVQINPATGSATQVGLSSKFFPNQIGLSFDQTGTLYLKSATELYTIDRTTGQPSLVRSLSALTNNVLAFDHANRAYSITRNYSFSGGNRVLTSSFLRQIDINTGEVTTIGGNLGLEITALVFTQQTAAIPEPCSMLGLLAGLLFGWRSYNSRNRREGSSITSLIVLKKLTASRPSTMRWS